MTSEISVDSFFPVLAQELEPLFSEKTSAWNALDDLREYLREYINPNIQEFAEPMIPLTSHVVLLPEGWLTEGFEVVCNKETKGKVQVWIEGKHVPKASLLCAGAVFSDYLVQIGSGVIIEPGVLIKGPTIIGDNTEVRHGAYIRGNCLFGKKCIVGHTTEVKHSIFMDKAKAGHFAYVGDSILGGDVNLGAGTKLANFRFAPGTITIKINGEGIDTQRRKLGAILGNQVQTGCNSVTNPGVFVGHSSIIAPNITVRPGYYKPKSVIR